MMILDKYPVVVDYTWGMDIFGFILAILAVVAILCAILLFKDYEDGLAISLLFVGLLLALASTLFFAHATPIHTTQYDVVLEEDYSAKDLVEDYVIVEQRGDIISIQEREEK